MTTTVAAAVANRNRVDLAAAFGSTCAVALAARPAKTFQCLRVLGDIFGQELQRNETTKLGVLCLVNHTHSPAAQFLDDAV